jgi:quercetin dioxygenase-like cupin family protein
MDAQRHQVAPIALEHGEGEARWVFGTLALIKADCASTAGRVSVIELIAPQGAGSPLHVHGREDEWFYVLEGALNCWVGGRTIAAPAGSFVYGPRGIAHTFQATSPQARFLQVAELGGFDGFLRACPSRRLPTRCRRPAVPRRTSSS